jgi:hypothetical protein
VVLACPQFPPRFDHVLRVTAIGAIVHVQAFVAKLVVEGFDV